MAPLTLWQNAVSIHQAPFVRALACVWPGPVSVVADTGNSPRRQRAGWGMPDYGEAKLTVGHERFRPGDIEARFGGAGSVHLFSSIGAYPGVHDALRRIARQPDALVGIYAESGADHDPPKAWLRPWRHRLSALNWRRRVDFFLAAGSKGTRYYAGVGFRPERLYPFGYAVAAAPRATPAASEARRLLYVGELRHLKGVDLLLDAVARLGGDRWQLGIVGDGAHASQYREQADRLGIAGKVSWHGNIPNDKVRELMGTTGMVILPSRYDGWGAVVNEALMAGTPVVVSEACGAADLVRGSDRGMVFERGSVAGLKDAIAEQARRLEQGSADRAAIRAWADQAISPEAFARYFIAVVEHARGKAPRPVAPWMAS
jgi:glycosyltransferase involved in cell wall biosynthesis